MNDGEGTPERLVVTPSAVLGYTFLRVGMGTVFLLYGVGRLLRDPRAVGQGLRERFAHTWLPEGLVQLFGTMLPFAELVLGPLLILGLLTRLTLTASGFLLLALVMGSAVEPDPATVANNLFFLAVVATLLWLQGANVLSTDAILRDRKRGRDG